MVEYKITEKDIPMLERISQSKTFNFPRLLYRIGACKSVRQARDLIKQGAVRVNGIVENFPGDLPFLNGDVIRVGSRFIRQLKF